jgi:hypothetical protein
MLPRKLAGFALTLGAAAGALVACSEQDSLAPVITPHGVENPGDGQDVATLAGLPVGNYLLTVYATTTGRGAVLDAYVRDASGNPATSGIAVFYYCSRQGKPTPRAACLTGSGRWVRYGSAGIISTGTKQGHALMGYTEAPPSGTTIGFRSRYMQGSTIASGYSNSANYTWP